MVTHLTIVRHGTTEGMEQGLVHGRMDAPLSELGLKQAQSAAKSLRGRKYDAFYSSPTGRAWQTAEIVSSVIGQKPEPLDLLVERDFGPMEGKKSKGFSRVLFFLNYYLDWLFTFKNGCEPLKTVNQRAKNALKMMIDKNPGGSILIVSHFGLINMLLRQATGQRFKFFMILPATVIELETNGYQKGKILSIRKANIV